jgi:anti-anti-sigma factor
LNDEHSEYPYVENYSEMIESRLSNARRHGSITRMKVPAAVDVPGVRVRFQANRDVDQGLIINVAGDPGHEEYRTLELSIASAINDGWTHVVVEATDLRYLRSVGIAKFKKLLEMTKERGGRLIICGLSPELGKQIHLLGLGSMLHLAYDVDDAMQQLKDE